MICGLLTGGVWHVISVRGYAADSSRGARLTAFSVYVYPLPTDVRRLAKVPIQFAVVWRAGVVRVPLVSVSRVSPSVTLCCGAAHPRFCKR